MKSSTPKTLENRKKSPIFKDQRRNVVKMAVTKSNLQKSIPAPPNEILDRTRKKNPKIHVEIKRLQTAKSTLHRRNTVT